MPSTRASTTTSLDPDDALAPGLGAQEWAGRPPAAVILATSQRVVEGYAADQLVCLTEFDERSVLEWWAGYLTAWGLTDITIVASQAHRSYFVPPSPDEPADADAERGVPQHRDLTDDPHGPTGLAGLGRYVFLGRHVPPDPLAQLLEVLPGIDNELLVVIDGDTLPPPVNPYTLVPTVVDAACLALGPVAPGWSRGYAVEWAPGAGQVPVTAVVSDPQAAPPQDWFGESLGILGARRSRLQAAAADPHPIQEWNDLHATWAATGELSGRVYGITPLRFTTTAELAAARADFPAWRTNLAHSLGDDTAPDLFGPRRRHAASDPGKVGSDIRGPEK